MLRRLNSGFTLYEILITILIVGVVLSLGVPNIQSFRLNSQMIAAANDLHSSFHLARSEASRAKRPITICASPNSMAAVPTCDGELEAGWIIFEDTDGDIQVDVNEPVLRRFPPVKDTITVNTPGTIDYFSFAANGQGRGNVNGTAPLATMVLCDSRGNVIGGGGRSTARVVIATPLGRAMVLADQSQVEFHGGC